MTSAMMGKRERAITRNLLNVLIDRSGQRVWVWSSLTFLVVTGLVALVVYNGPSHIVAPWDIFILLDSGWRIFSGQIPHTDFHNPIGPLTYELIALGMRLAGPSLRSIAYSDVIFVLGTTTWAWLVSRSRLSALNSFLFTLFVALLSLATRPLGFDPHITTYALIYNRYGWVLYSVLLVELFIEPQAETRASKVWNGLSIGLLLGFLFFDKITYFAAGVAATVLQVILRRSSARSIGGQLVGFLSVCLVMSWAFQINILSYIQDVLSAGRAQSLVLRLHFLGSSVKHNWLNILLFGAILLLLYATIYKPDSGGPATTQVFTTLITVGFCWLSAFLIASGDAPEASDIPVVFVSALILLEAVSWRINWQTAVRPTAAEISYGITFLLALVAFAGPIMLKDALSLVYTSEWRAYRLSPASAGQRFDSAALADFVIPASSDYQTAYVLAKYVPAQINDGLQLLRQHITSQSRIFTVGLTNPFAIALDLPSPQGTLAWWDLNFSISTDYYPSAARTFQDVDLVMVPVQHPQDAGCCWPTVEQMLTVYGPYLQEHFVQVGQTPYWILLEQRH